PQMLMARFSATGHQGMVEEAPSRAQSWKMAEAASMRGRRASASFVSGRRAKYATPQARAMRAYGRADRSAMVLSCVKRGPRRTGRCATFKMEARGGRAGARF